MFNRIPYIRLLILLLLSLLGFYQDHIYHSPQLHWRNDDNAEIDHIVRSPPKELPLEKRDVDSAAVERAVRYLRLPVWSHGYAKCDSSASEVSCYEVVRAARAIEQWESDVRNNRTDGKVIVNVDAEGFGDRLTMLYHGIQIAIATHRSLYTDLTKFGNLKLPIAVQQLSPSDKYMELPTDSNFGCCDVSYRYPNLGINGNSWPQALYTHHVIAPWLRRNFGFHAAYFIGNYLFGEEHEPSECNLSGIQGTAVEGFGYYHGEEIKPEEFHSYLPRCGEHSQNVEIVTNREINGDHKCKAVTHYDDRNITEAICAIRKLTRSKRIIQTFGSRIGFWANALQGTKGGFINTFSRVCINMTNSQQGSIWHTYCPWFKTEVFRTSSFFSVCGPNAEDARLYIEYLLW